MFTSTSTFFLNLELLGARNYDNSEFIKKNSRQFETRVGKDISTEVIYICLDPVDSCHKEKQKTVKPNLQHDVDDWEFRHQSL